MQRHRLLSCSRRRPLLPVVCRRPSARRRLMRHHHSSSLLQTTRGRRWLRALLRRRSFCPYPPPPSLLRCVSCCRAQRPRKRHCCTAHLASAGGCALRTTAAPPAPELPPAPVLPSHGALLVAPAQPPRAACQVSAERPRWPAESRLVGPSVQNGKQLPFARRHQPLRPVQRPLDSRPCRRGVATRLSLCHLPRYAGVLHDPLLVAALHGTRSFRHASRQSLARRCARRLFPGAPTSAATAQTTAMVALLTARPFPSRLRSTLLLLPLFPLVDV